MNQLKVPPSFEVGDYYLGWFIDPGDVVQEYDETNNLVLYQGGTQLVTIAEPPPPPLPATFSASDGHFTDRVQLEWEIALGATFYFVYRAENIDGPYTEIASDLITTEFADNSAVQGQAYYYKLRTWRQFGGFSEETAPDFGLRSPRVGITHGRDGTPWPLPGRLQAEDHDSGAASDSTPENLGGKYRLSSSVDIEQTSDVGLGHNIMLTDAGEWTEYTVDMDAGGQFTIGLRLAAETAGSSLRLSSNGADLLGVVDVPATAGSQSWATVEVPGVLLSEGVQIFRVEWVSGSGGANLNWISVIPDAYAGGDTDTDGDGLRNLDEFKFGTDTALADSDGDGQNDGIELALGSDPLDADSTFDANRPSIGINFSGQDSDPLAANDVEQSGEAGLSPFRFWNNVRGSEGVTGGMRESDGSTTSCSLRWQADGVGSLEQAGATVPQSADGALLNGYLTAEGDGLIEIDLAGIPFLEFDVIVYADRASDLAGAQIRHSSVELEETGQDFWFADNRNWDGTYIQALGVDVAAATPGSNVAVFRGVSTSAIKLKVNAQGLGAAINGIQIIGNQRASLEMTGFEKENAEGNITISFKTDANRTYRIATSADLQNWTPIEDQEAIPGSGEEVERQFPESSLPQDAERRYIQVQEEPQ